MKKIICNFFRSFIIINKCIRTKDKNKTDKINNGTNISKIFGILQNYKKIF